MPKTLRALPGGGAFSFLGVVGVVFLAPKNSFAIAAERVLSLPEDTAAARARLEITVAVQARQIGVGKSTLTRLEAGGSPTQATIVSVLRWLAIHGGN